MIHYLKQFIFVYVLCVPLAFAQSLDIDACFENPDSCLDIDESTLSVKQDSGDEEEVSGLTIKTGQVISNGFLYEGASPKAIAALKKQIEDGKEPAGLFGASVYIYADENVLFVPVSSLVGKSRSEMRSIITATVVNEVTELDLDIDHLADEIREAEGNLNEALNNVVNDTIAEVQKNSQIQSAVANSASVSEQAANQLESSSARSGLDKVLSAANDYYSAGYSSSEIAEAAEIANAATAALPEDLQRTVNEVVNNAALAIEVASSDIDAALRTWDSLSDQAKEDIVNEANRLGALGCGANYRCTVQDAENYADNLR